MIETAQDLDRPGVSTQADVTLVGRGITVTARVTRSDDAGLVVAPLGLSRSGHASIKPGDSAEVYWLSAYDERRLPARIVTVDSSRGTRWHLLPTAPAERSQRRRTVRAEVELPLVMPNAGGLLTGTTIDLSENGLRCRVDGWGLPPAPGTPVEVTLTLEDDGDLHLQGRVARVSDRGSGRWVLAVSFPDVSEKDGDTLRRRVFRALREERARLAD